MKETLKKFSIALVLVPVLGLMLLGAVATPSRAAGDDFDAAAAYKAKCLMCHGPTAAKNFDPAKDDAAHVQAILKGVKGEKPPFMPAYETKGVTEEQARALVAHMKSIRQ
jgi:mono/diheme cytochrome c family protein